ncbi:homeobox-leucine zipper protein GLABRA [Striga asiatica]|uniref:Homeobox-leucine zipper protein GLABRA n=1 Tax=Striga asiatica TaxID=4170 RepID=A0A5A7QWS3_STRAF|nr:homeobox-leucine zipper protein GLABRA [Striga asiatica]
MSLADMSNLPHPPDFLSSPALTLSLAGIFREEGGGGGRREEAVEMSSENSGAAAGKSRSDDDCELLPENGDEVLEDDDENNDGDRKNKRKKYHRHTTEQIREMEALFKESPHPDEKQRLQLSKQLGLHPRQVKFWFQNRRTQIKNDNIMGLTNMQAIQERHENSLLKSEIDKLRDQNKALRDAVKNSSCPNCGFGSSTNDAVSSTHDQKLRIENARLKAEVEKLTSIIGKHPPPTSQTGSSCHSSNDQENKSPLDFCMGNFGLEKSHIMDAIDRATDELHKMATQGEPLWIRSFETGREILNYDEYVKEICGDNRDIMQQTKKLSIEASRESRAIFVDLPWLVQSFMDVNQWKELFPGMLAKAAIVDVICSGEGANKNGAVHLMFAEMQMLTPMVATREVYFIRHCKQLSPNQWAIVEVSIDKIEDKIDASLMKCRKRPSGCIIEDKSNGHCKVTWVEHLECQKTMVHSLYRTVVNSGLAYSAKRWISTLQQQCERLVFLVATNVPTRDSSGVATLAGRKSILKLAQRMTWNFCRALGDSSYNSWNKITTKTGDDIRLTSRKNISDTGVPLGTILCAVSCVWLPVSPHALFDFLRDESRRNEAMKTNEHNTWILQDNSTNAYEATVVYAPVDANGMQSVMTGCDSSNIAVLPSGFSILPDGIESRPFVITSKPDEKGSEGGSLLTIAFQMLIGDSTNAKLSIDSVDVVNTLISCTLQNIKRSLQCED